MSEPILIGHSEKRGSLALNLFLEPDSLKMRQNGVDIHQIN